MLLLLDFYLCIIFLFCLKPKAKQHCAIKLALNLFISGSNLHSKESDEGLYQVLLIKNQMGVCTKFYSLRIRRGMYQVLLLTNQMGYVSSFTPHESDGGLYQILLLKKQMVQTLI
jgi:hypothetical protein